MKYKDFNLDLFQQQYLEELIRVVYPGVVINDIVPYSSNWLAIVDTNNIYYGYVRCETTNLIIQNGTYQTIDSTREVLALFDGVDDNGVAVYFVGFRVSVENRINLGGETPPPVYLPFPEIKMREIFYSADSDNTNGFPSLNLFINHNYSPLGSKIRLLNAMIDINYTGLQSISGDKKYYFNSVAAITGTTQGIAYVMPSPDNRVSAAYFNQLFPDAGIKPFTFLGFYNSSGASVTGSFSGSGSVTANFNRRPVYKLQVKVDRRTTGGGTWTNLYDVTFLEGTNDSFNVPIQNTSGYDYRIVLYPYHEGLMSDFGFIIRYNY